MGERLPISYDVYITTRRGPESFKEMLQRLDSTINERTNIAKILRISRRTLYRLLKEYKISEYGDN